MVQLSVTVDCAVCAAKLHTTVEVEALPLTRKIVMPGKLRLAVSEHIKYKHPELVEVKT